MNEETLTKEKEAKMRVRWTIRGHLDTETDIGELSPEDLVSGRIESWRVWTGDTTVETVAEEDKTKDRETNGVIIKALQQANITLQTVLKEDK